MLSFHTARVVLVAGALLGVGSLTGCDLGFGDTPLAISATQIAFAPGADIGGTVENPDGE